MADRGVEMKIPKIIIIHEDELFVDFLKRILARSLGNEIETKVLVERNGKALRMLGEVCANEAGHIIVVTNLGKNNDGLILTKAIKAQTWGKKVFVAVTSGSGSRGEDVIDAGASLFIKTPIKNINALGLDLKRLLSEV